MTEEATTLTYMLEPVAIHQVPRGIGHAPRFLVTFAGGSHSLELEVPYPFLCHLLGSDGLLAGRLVRLELHAIDLDAPPPAPSPWPPPVAGTRVGSLRSIVPPYRRATRPPTPGDTHRDHRPRPD